METRMVLGPYRQFTKPIRIWGRVSCPHLYSYPQVYEDSPWVSPGRRNNVPAENSISPLMAAEHHLSLPQGAFQGASTAA